MDKTSVSPCGAPTRRTVLGQLAGSALLAVAPPVVSPSTASAAARLNLPNETLVSLWEHSAKVDIAPVVKEVGFNTVWTHDKPYDGTMKLEDTLMYRHMHTPGVKYVIPKVERGIWGWSFEQAMRHTEWIAELSKTQKQIIGLYLNDFYVDLMQAAKGGHTMKEFKQMIAKARSINPQLPIWVPMYPMRETDHSFDFDFDVLIFSIHFETFNRKWLPNTEEHLVEAEKKFAKKKILTGFYIHSAPDGKRDEPRLTEDEFRFLMRLFVKHINEGKTIGLRIFRAQDFIDEPKYATWAKEELANLKRA